MLATIGPTDWDPFVDLVPVQPPEAVQLVALVVPQVKVELPPLVTDDGLDVSVIVGVGVETEMSTDLDELPPAPAQVSVKVLEA